MNIYNTKIHHPKLKKAIRKIMQPFLRKRVHITKAEPCRVYAVSWMSRNGEYISSKERSYRTFIDYDSALEFVSSLEDAARLLRYTEDIDIRIKEFDNM